MRLPDDQGAEPPATSREWLHCARAFSAIFWGLLASLLTLHGLVGVHLPFMHRTPACVLALLPLGAALLLLRRAFFRDRSWHRAVHAFALALAVQTFLLPFLGWWRNLSVIWYLALNLTALIISGMVLLAAVPIMGEQVARKLSNPTLRAECRLCLWSVLLLSGLALLLVGVHTGVFAMRANPAFALRHALIIESPLAVLLLAMPHLPALAAAWNLKEHCLRHLTDPPPPSEIA